MQTDPARTLDMFKSWTQMDFEGLNSPTNAIYMTMQEHSTFGSFTFYLDKEAVSHLYDDLFVFDLGLILSSTQIFQTNTNTGCVCVMNSYI